MLYNWSIFHFQTPPPSTGGNDIQNKIMKHLYLRPKRNMVFEDGLENKLYFDLLNFKLTL